MKKILLYLIVLTLCVCTNVYVFAYDHETQMKIVINIPLRNLILYRDGEIVKTYPIAVGKPSSQTPIGEFKITNKAVNPYYSKKNIPGGDPSNPLGSRWIGFMYKYGIHGNSEPKSIGTFASGGCVRMYERDVQELYKLVSEGTPVTIKYELFKVENDVDGLNPVLTVYPDYYSKESDIIKKITTLLNELNLKSKISNEKLDGLKKLVTKNQVVFSDKWTYFINGKYITNDIINNNGEILVNVDKIGKFFNVEILKDQDEKHIRILDITTPIKQIEGKNYMLLNEIEKVLGGSHTIDSNTERVDYRLNYVLLNNKLIIGEALDFQNNHKIPIEPLINTLRFKVDIKQESTKIICDNKEIEYSIINEETYVEANKLIEILDARIEVFTVDNHIEIFSKPDIIYNGTIYKGRIISNEVYVPCHMFEPTIGRVDSEAKEGIMLDRVDIINLDDEKYFRISDLLYYFDIESDLYNTKIRINRKIL